MDGSDNGTVRTHRNHTIGFVGRGTIKAKEHAALVSIGRLIARLDRVLAIVPAPGVAEAVREGMTAEGGETLELVSDVIGTADHTFVVPDKRLLSRLSTAYPDLAEKPNVTIANNVADLLTAVQTIAKEHGIE